MALRKKEFAIDVANSFEVLFGQDVDDPALDEAIQEYYGDCIVLEGAYEDFQSCLPRVRTELESRGHHVMLVNRAYYETYKRTCPDTPDECWCCLPKGSPSYGIRKMDGDLLSETWTLWMLKSTAGRDKKTYCRLLGAIKDGVLDKEQVRGLLERRRNEIPEEIRKQIAALFELEPPAKKAIEGP